MPAFVDFSAQDEAYLLIICKLFFDIFVTIECAEGKIRGPEKYWITCCLKIKAIDVQVNRL